MSQSRSKSSRGAPAPKPRPVERIQTGLRLEKRIVKVLGPEELGKRASYSRPHTVHCGPGGVFVSCLGGDGAEGPGGVALLDPGTFEVAGQWETDRGDQYLGIGRGFPLGEDPSLWSTLELRD